MITAGPARAAAPQWVRRLRRVPARYALSGLIALVLCLAVDYRTLADKSHLIYIGVVLLLVYVLFFGAVRGGSRRLLCRSFTGLALRK